MTPPPEALRLLGRAAGEVLHVGDSFRSDVAGAAAVGIPAAWVNRTGRAAPEGPRPAYEVASLTALPPLLGRAAPSHQS
ncbi:HAD family hydrolase [Streptomyces sp. MS19]|uniref:HAD family hydrolase n=1 Tax=Streptomyces sp. MS19 TaxID=3385972 RepID=UPI0039A2A429